LLQAFLDLSAKLAASRFGDTAGGPIQALHVTADQLGAELCHLVLLILILAPGEPAGGSEQAVPVASFLYPAMVRALLEGPLSSRKRGIA
jgi:hypothetical protein